LTGLAAMIVVACPFVWQVLHTRQDQAALELLRSPEPESRKRGAWLAAEHRTPRAWQHIAAALDRRDRWETDAGARESYVHALGRSGQRQYFDAVAQAACPQRQAPASAQPDPDGYVRQAAWLAAARLDPQRFRELAAQTPPADDPWDQIGLSGAWLEVGDLRGVDQLLHWAEAGTLPQRQVASLALLRGVAPLLEAAGRWPIQFVVREGQAWPSELVAEVRRRSRSLDLRAIADDTRPHLARAASVHRNVGRLNSMRARLVRLLFGP
jgi:hypothetical protein